MADAAETKTTEKQPEVVSTEDAAAAEASDAAPVAEPETTTPEETKPEVETAPAVGSAEAAGEDKTEETTTEETAEKKEDEVTEDAAGAEAAPDKEDKTEGESAEEPAAAEEETIPEPIEIPSGNGELVLVTGATGYLASHIIKQLHESGEFKVRGTVRNLEDNSKLDSLKTLLQSGGEGEAGDDNSTVEFVEADLTKPDSWTEAVKDCEYVIHTASPFPITNPANESEVIEPARDGTIAVLKACAEAKSVKRVVITSSIAAIVAGRSQDKNAVNEETWADVQKSQSAYDKSKAIAERAAWEFIKELPEDSNLELSVVNPGFIVGPPLMKMDCTSVEVIKKLMNREYSAVPKLSFPCTDVRDVALAHIRAMMIKQAAGQRHIVCGTSCWLKDMANMMSQEFNSQGFNIPTTQAPYVLVWLKSHMDPQLKRILPDVGKLHQFDTNRMMTILQVEPRDVKTSLIEMGHAMINLEIVHKVEKVEKKSRKLTFRKKKEKKVEEENEEKKDEPEKAASTSGSADNGSVPDEAALEDVEIKVEAEPAPAESEDKPEETANAESKEDADEIKAAGEEEVKTETAAEEEKAPSDSAAVHSEEEVKADEAITSDPESSKKKDKKAKKEKKEKGEKKKGGIFSFSFKKKQKPHVEKKAEAEKSDEEAAATSTAAEDKPAEESAPAVSDESPAAAPITEEAAPVAAPTTEEAAPAAAPTTEEAAQSSGEGESQPAVEETEKVEDKRPTEEEVRGEEASPDKAEEEPKTDDDKTVAAE